MNKKYATIKQTKPGTPKTCHGKLIAAITIIALLSACSTTSTTHSKSWKLQNHAMAAAADPRAVSAAVDILKAGGHAVDAAIAAHAVLGLVEPQSSGLGGGAFMVVYERKSGKILVYDGREAAPAKATPELFMRNGKPMPFPKAWQGGVSIGVPGAVALYKTAHNAHGNLTWEKLFSPARELARKGFVVSPRLASLLANKRIRKLTRLDDNPISAEYFYPGGNPLKTGQLRPNPQYAELLDNIATDGPGAFYSGPVAQNIVDQATAPPEPGSLSLEDLENYTVKTRNALCGTFRTFLVCSAPPPASGGVTQPAILGLYDLFMERNQDKSEWISAFVDAQRLVYADRDHYIADPEHTIVKPDDFLDPKYLAARAQDRFKPDQPVKPGDPGLVLRNEPMIQMWGSDHTRHAPGTTHLSVVDFDGNVVSMTATVEAIFGSSRMTENGFLLNNELTDFSLEPVIGGRTVANTPGPEKRPRSSMSPTIVLNRKSGQFVMSTGSPGGNSIIAYVAKSLVGVLDHGLTAQQAVELPNIIARGNTVRVETGSDAGKAVARSLRNKGYRVKTNKTEISGLHVIVATENGYDGGADPRREGEARAVLAPPH